MDYVFDPRVPTVEKVLVDPADIGDAQRVEEIKASLAAKVRASSSERAALTPAAAVTALMWDLPQERMTEILTEMGNDDRYADVKAVVTGAGMVYLYSDRHVDAAAATAKSLVEDCKFVVGETVRSDSRDKVALTPSCAIEALLPDKEPEEVAAVVEEVQRDPRFADICTIQARDGQVYYHSNAYLSGNYALVLVRAMANDPCAAIAETVRDASRIYPRPTNATLFREKAFALDPARVDALVEETLKKPEYADVKKMVHPETGAVYLYSDKFLAAERAYYMMDWVEVGKANNP